MANEAETIRNELRQWRREHPKASLDEIDAEVERRFRGLLTETVEELATQDGEPVRCPQCQQPMQRRGQHPRTVQGRGGKTLNLRRSYAVCPACGTGLFPPG